MQTTLGTTLVLTLAASLFDAQRTEPPAVRVVGHGPGTWVLLSGMIGGVAGFRQLESRLVAEGYRVVTIDPYHLSLDSADVSLDAMARRVSSVLAGLDVCAMHLVGHSHGGGVALRVAAHVPAAVVSVHLLDAGALPGQRGRVFGSAIRLVPVITRLPGGRGFVRRRLVAGLRDNSARIDWLTADVQQAYAEPMLGRIGDVVGMAIRLGRATEPEPLVAVLTRITAPVHALLGAVSAPAGPDSTEISALGVLRIPPVVERLDGVAHFPHEEAPDVVARALLRHAAPRARCTP